MDELTLFDFMEDGKQYKPIVSNDWKWTFADYPKQKNGIKVFSCFACGGGSTMGYKLAGCEVLGCCEIDKQMNEIYVANHHPKYNFLMDIRDFNKIQSDELPTDLFDLDILDGSPPCTTFSIAGLREKTWGEKKKFREGQKEQTMDDLAFVFIETVQKLKPKVVIMENVEGLIIGNAWQYVQRIYKELTNVGYSVAHWLLKGEKMGVPQTRHRVFFVAVRNDLGVNPKEIDMCFNYEPVVFGKIKTDEGRPVKMDSVLYKVLQRAEFGDADLSDTLKRLEGRDSLFTHKLVYDHLVMPTITAKAEFFRFPERRGLSDKDVIYSQTFPDDYNFGNQNVIYVCGMSVPPVMMKRVVQRLIDEGVFDYKKEEQKNADSN